MQHLGKKTASEASSTRKKLKVLKKNEKHALRRRSPRKKKGESTTKYEQSERTQKLLIEDNDYGGEQRPPRSGLKEAGVEAGFVKIIKKAKKVIFREHSTLGNYLLKNGIEAAPAAQQRLAVNRRRNRVLRFRSEISQFPASRFIAAFGCGQDLPSAVVNEHANLVEPPITTIRSPPGTQSLNIAERGKKKLLMLCNHNLHYGRLSPSVFEGILFAAEGQLDHHPIPQSRDPTQRAVSRLGA